jgi:transposase
MRQPACLAPWVPEVELLEWLRDAASVDEHRRRMVVWLTHFGRWHAHEVAEMVGVSVQAVWKWVGQYNRQGPPGLRRRGRGGRRWSFLTVAQESELLRSLEARAARGDILTAKQVLPLASDAAGRDVSLAYVYSLLRRQGWRKLGPRPHHVKGDAEARAQFKKNFRT